MISLIDIVDVALRLGLVSIIIGLILDKINEKKKLEKIRKIIKHELEDFEAKTLGILYRITQCSITMLGVENNR